MRKRVFTVNFVISGRARGKIAHFGNKWHRRVGREGPNCQMANKHQGGEDEKVKEI